MFEANTDPRVRDAIHAAHAARGDAVRNAVARLFRRR